MKDITEGLLYEFYAGVISGRAAEVMSAYYLEDLSQSEIAANLSITKQGVKDYIDRSLNKIRKIEAATGAYARYRRTVEFLAEIKKGTDGETADKIERFLIEN